MKQEVINRNVSDFIEESAMLLPGFEPSSSKTGISLGFDIELEIIETEFAKSFELRNNDAKLSQNLGLQLTRAEVKDRSGNTLNTTASLEGLSPEVSPSFPSKSILMRSLNPCRQFSPVASVLVNNTSGKDFTASRILESCDNVDNWDEEIAGLNLNCITIKDKVNSIAQKRVEGVFG
jgi:hypothetical protein